MADNDSGFRLNVHSELWCIHPGHLHRLQMAGDNHAPSAEVTANVMERRNLSVNGRVAIVSVDDVMVPRGGFWWGLPTDQLGSLVGKLADDNSISSIVLDIDSPGGSVYGMQELNQQIVAARERKPVWAVANPLAASAAFELLSAAGRRFVAPGGQVGSHGVIYRHLDHSQMLEDMGVKQTVIRSTPNKDEFSLLEPLSESARSRLEEVVEHYQGIFTATLAKNYGISKSQVDKTFGQGRVFNDKEAIAAGMVEQIATLSEVVGRITGRGPGGRRGSRAGASVAGRRKRLDLHKRNR